MHYFFAVLLGAVQGITEFLPISSTAHLIILQKLFNLDQNMFGLSFDASVHLGTLFAVIIFFFKDYIQIFNLKNKLFLKIIIGTIPAVIAGFYLEDKIESDFRSLMLIGISLIFFSILMIIAEYIGKKHKTDEKITTAESLIIGIAQSIALIPGVSRSGATISAGLFLGQTRKSAARFAFLLSGPIIAGAGFKKLLDAVSEPAADGRLELLVLGILSAFCVGYITIKYFLKYLEKNNLYLFIIYRILLGIALILFPLFAN